MGVTIRELSPGIGRLTIDGTDFFGVRVSSHTRGVGGQLLDARRETGWIVRGEEVAPWELAGLIECEGRIYAYGPDPDGRSLSSLFDEDKQAALATLVRLGAAYRLLLERKADLSRPRLAGVALLRDGFLFLPRGVLDYLRSSQTERERIDSTELWSHPDLDGESGASFFLALLAYRVLTGELPFKGASEEELHERMRTQVFLPPRYLSPEIAPEVSESVARALASPPRLAELVDDLSRWSRDGFARALSEGERRSIEDVAGRARAKQESGFRVKGYVQRNWRMILVTAAIVLVVGLVGGSIAKNALKPRITVGLSPEAVVRLFYTSINSYDSLAMQDCVVGGAGKSEITEATTLYVTARVREGYEGKSGYLLPEEWRREGYRPLKPGEAVYGITDLSITENANGSFAVSYEKWVPEAPPDADPEAQVVMRIHAAKRVDLVTVKNEGKFWAITSIKNVEQEAVAIPSELSASSSR